MGALLRDDLYMGAFSLRIIIHVIDVLTSARLRLAAMLNFGISVTFLGFFACHCVVLFGRAFNIATKTTDIEDTYPTLTAIPF